MRAEVKCLAVSLASLLHPDLELDMLKVEKLQTTEVISSFLGD